MESGTWKVKTGLAQMLKGGVIMDVVNSEHARIAEEAGSCAVMALERVPSDIRAAGGVARMADPTIIEAIMKAVSIPVMAKCRIGHFVEAQTLEAMGVDYIEIFSKNSRAFQCTCHSPSCTNTRGIGRSDVERVSGHSAPNHFGVYTSATPDSRFFSF